MRAVLASLALASLLLAPAPGAADGPGTSPTAPAATSPAAAAPKFEFETFQLVLLMRAPTWKKLPDAEAQALQAQHIGHLTRMWEAGKAAVCGPFGNQQDPAYRGACLYRVATPEEARTLAEQDPVIRAGQLRAEVITWAVEKGHMTFPKTPAAAAP